MSRRTTQGGLGREGVQDLIQRLSADRSIREEILSFLGNVRKEDRSGCHGTYISDITQSAVVGNDLLSVLGGHRGAYEFVLKICVLNIATDCTIFSVSITAGIFCVDLLRESLPFVVCEIERAPLSRFGDEGALVSLDSLENYWTAVLR